MYRLSRNVEASLIDYITTQLTTDGWVGIRTEKSFAEVYKGTLPCICVNVLSRPDIRREIGSDALSKFVNIEIRIFTKSDGMRLDLADWMVEHLMTGINYYEYTIVSGVVDTKVLKGRLNFLEIVTNRKELRVTDNVAKEDRYRQLISFRCRVATT